MPSVPPTNFTTDSNTSQLLDLGTGFKMFGPGREHQRAVLLKTGTWCQKTVNFEILKLDFSLSYGAFTGDLGPSYAMDLETTTDSSYTIPAPGQGATADVYFYGTDPAHPNNGTGNDLQGGWQLGFEFGIYGELALYSNWLVKKKLFDWEPGVGLDMWTVLQWVLAALFSTAEEDGQGKNQNSKFKDAEGDVEQAAPLPPQEDAGRKRTPTPPKAGDFVPFFGGGLLDYIAEPWTQGAGKSIDGPPQNTLHPQLSFDIDIIPLLKEFPPPADIIYALEEFLDKLKFAELSLGPGLGIGFPITVTLDGMTIDNHVFEVVRTSTDTSSRAVTHLELQEKSPDPSLAPLGETPHEFGVLLTHEVGLELELYFFAAFTFFKVFNFGFKTAPIDINSLAGASPDIPIGGPYQNQLSFVPGGGEVPFLAPGAPTIAGYTANQPKGKWKNGVIAQYGVSFFKGTPGQPGFYESPVGTLTSNSDQAALESRFFALAKLTNIPTDPNATGRRIYRIFNDGTPIELIGTINDDTTTTFTDTDF